MEINFRVIINGIAVICSFLLIVIAIFNALGPVINRENITNKARIIQYNHRITIPLYHENHIDKVYVSKVDGVNLDSIYDSYVDLKPDLHQVEVSARHGYKLLISKASFNLDFCAECVYFFEMEILGVDFTFTTGNNQDIQPKTYESVKFRHEFRYDLYKVRLTLFVDEKNVILGVKPILLC